MQFYLYTATEVYNWSLFFYYQGKEKATPPKRSTRSKGKKNKNEDENYSDSERSDKEGDSDPPSDDVEVNATLVGEDAVHWAEDMLNVGVVCTQFFDVNAIAHMLNSALECP